VRLSGTATNIGTERSLLGEFSASAQHRADLKSATWSAMGHGDAVFVIRINFDPATGNVTPNEYHDHWIAKQALGEDQSPIADLMIPKTGTVRFLARATSGADSASFVAEIVVEE
jgi:hypothetical protein